MSGRSKEELTTLYLPSNTYCDYFDNRTSHFKIDLAAPIQLREGAKVALSEVIYPNSLQNIHDENNTVVFIKYIKHHDEWQRRKWTEHIPEKYYKTAQELLDAINAVIPRRRMAVQLQLDEKTQKCKIIVESGETIILHKSLSNLLGFFERTKFEQSRGALYPQSFTGEVVPDVSLLTFSLFIYSDIVYPTKVGSDEVPILGILKCDNETTASQYNHKTLPVLNFVPVIGSTLSRIEIKITDTTGELIRFQFGKVILKLILSQPKE